MAEKRIPSPDGAKARESDSHSSEEEWRKIPLMFPGINTIDLQEQSKSVRFSIPCGEMEHAGRDDQRAPGRTRRKLPEIPKLPCSSRDDRSSAVGLRTHAEDMGTFAPAVLHQVPSDPRGSPTLTLRYPEQFQSSSEVGTPGCGLQSAARSKSAKRHRRHRREPTPEELRIQQEEEALVDEIFEHGRSLSRNTTPSNNDDINSDEDSSGGLMLGDRRSDLPMNSRPSERHYRLMESQSPANQLPAERPGRGRRRNTIILERDRRKAKHSLYCGTFFLMLFASAIGSMIYILHTQCYGPEYPGDPQIEPGTPPQERCPIIVYYFVGFTVIGFCAVGGLVGMWGYCRYKWATTGNPLLSR